MTAMLKVSERWTTWTAVIAIVAFAALVFRAWLDPGNVSAWFALWVRGLCS